MSGSLSERSRWLGAIAGACPGPAQISVAQGPSLHPGSAKSVPGSPAVPGHTLHPGVPAHEHVASASDRFLQPSSYLGKRQGGH